MRVNRENPDVVNSMDLLLPYSGESLGAAEREEDYKRLLKRLGDSTMIDLMIEVMQKDKYYRGKTSNELKDIAVSYFDWYLQLIKRNPHKHSGFGMGGNRIAQSIMASNDIRATSTYVVNKASIM
jgi:aspartyl/asparaginyl-tRNA synthetase